jgi:hypothetical protein
MACNIQQTPNYDKECAVIIQTKLIQVIQVSRRHPGAMRMVIGCKQSSLKWATHKATGSGLMSCGKEQVRFGILVLQ